MTGWPRARGSIRRRLTLQLLTSAAILAVILFLIVSSFARQISAESQDRILSASVASILDAVSVASGEVSVDIPYSAFTMLDNPSDDRVFYRIMQDGEVITGYDDLPATTPGTDATADNGETEGDTDQGTGADGDSGCSCRSGPPSGSAFALFVFALPFLRRRKSA